MQLVAVYCSEDEQWERGQVQIIFQKLGTVMYSIFLIDEGKSVNEDVHNVCQIPDMFRHLPPQVYKIGLYGVVPQEWSSGSMQK